MNATSRTGMTELTNATSSGGGLTDEDAANDYLSKTESAVRKLLQVLADYRAVLRCTRTPVFSGAFEDQAEADREFAHWAADNERGIQRSLAAQRRYTAETLARGSICGSVLQIAAMGVRQSAPDRPIPETFGDSIKAGTAVSRYCAGRLIRGVPLGLVVYAGRNQFNHMDDQELREPSRAVFRMLAVNHGIRGAEDVVDPAFDLSYGDPARFSGNIIYLLGWHSYDDYERDMRELLAPPYSEHGNRAWFEIDE